ncbi:MAG TPA: HPF/RaiA family ribosome-associated protein [Brumimicrobium sp.]|nr:HPF/RaiA family ribosome-associated protein [Brumimicrobium sp.]
MDIIFNTDKHIDGKERVEAYFTTEIKKELARFEDRVTRVEVHVSDENGSKSGVNDKKCTMEVRPKGLKPVAVSAIGDSTEQAINAATKKMYSSLNTVYGKLQNI